MIEVLKQAIEALQGSGYYDTTQQREAIASLRQAIAGLESQEPVALETVYETIIQWDEGGGKRSRRDLARRIIDLYTHPPQRKPLTDEEIVAINDKHYIIDYRDFDADIAIARAIEAAHGIKEKNND